MTAKSGCALSDTVNTIAEIILWRYHLTLSICSKMVCDIGE